MSELSEIREGGRSQKESIEGPLRCDVNGARRGLMFVKQGGCGEGKRKALNKERKRWEGATAMATVMMPKRGAEHGDGKAGWEGKHGHGQGGRKGLN